MLELRRQLILLESLQLFCDLFEFFIYPVEFLTRDFCSHRLLPLQAVLLELTENVVGVLGTDLV